MLHLGVEWGPQLQNKPSSIQPQIPKTLADLRVEQVVCGENLRQTPDQPKWKWPKQIQPQGPNLTQS